MINVLFAAAQDQDMFTVTCAEPYAVYDFIGKIADHYPDNELKKIFLQSTYNTEQNRKLLLDFEQLRIDYSYAYDQYPKVLKAAVMTRDLLEKQLATSQTVTEFRNRVVGILPNETLLSFCRIIAHFTPVYHELVAVPQKDRIEVQKNNLASYVHTNRFPDYFRTGLDFYNVSWDRNIPFTLNLLPSFDKDNLGARAFFNVAVCEASLDLKDHQALFSVVMHEIYHIIYDNQPLELKQHIRDWFFNTTSPNSQYAQLLLNEVLATALGNGYIMEQLNGKIDENDWYSNKYITGMAQAIYPTVKKYVVGRKPIDEAFVQTYVHLYDTGFPGWTKELDHLFMYRYIVADEPGDWQYIRSRFRYHSYNRLSAPMTASEIEKAKSTPVTKVFIIADGHKQKLGMLKTAFKELSGRRMDDQQEFIEVVVLEDRTKLFIVNRHRSTVAQLMDKYFPDKRIGAGKQSRSVAGEALSDTGSRKKAFR